jgi:L-malate glycosyltransferase
LSRGERRQQALAHSPGRDQNHTVAASVLHLIQRFYVGGAERQFIERLRAHPEGFEPVVGCLEISGGNLEEFRGLGIGEPSVFPLHGSLLRPNTFRQVLRIARLVRDRGCVLVHGTDFVTNFLGVCAARLAGVPALVSRVDMGHPRPGFGRWHRRLERLVSRAADAVCANAEAVRQLCIEEEGCRPEDVSVVRNGIDLARFDRLAAAPLLAPIPEGDLLVAVVANLWPVKGHRLFLDAVALAHERVPQARFLLVGDGPERHFLESRIAALGLGKTVFLLGTRYDVPAILARAHAACLPSRAEGLSNALMEEMTAGLPAVATDVGGNAELIEDGVSGFIVPPGDVRSLAARLSLLLSDREAARRMGAAARRKAGNELSLFAMSEGYRNLYSRILDKQTELVTEVLPGIAAGRGPR